jgi:hypothetical protein
MEHRSVTENVKGDFVIPTPEDITSGSYTEAEYLAKNASDQAAANKAAAGTCTTTTPGKKASNIG